MGHPSTFVPTPLATTWIETAWEEFTESGGTDFPVDLQAAVEFSAVLERSARAELAASWCEDLPHNPLALQRARVVFARQRTYAHLPDRDRVYREDLRVLWRAAGLRPIEGGDLAMLVAFSGRGGIRPDLTNLVKAVEDAGNGFLWTDDRQIRTTLGAIVGWGRSHPRRLGIDVWRLG